MTWPTLPKSLSGGGRTTGPEGIQEVIAALDEALGDLSDEWSYNQELWMLDLTEAATYPPS